MRTRTHSPRGLIRWTVCFVALLVTVVVTRADLTTKTATINDITIGYKIPCTDPPRQLNLGDVSITLADAGAFSDMSATLTIDAAAQSGAIWNCMQLHWLQTIWHLPGTPPVTYMTNAASIPIIDPPSGGWDYMYAGPGRTNPKPEYSVFFDNQPWYYNAAGEALHNTAQMSYNIEDGPADRADPEYVGFSTYLVAVSTATCTDTQPPECLKAGEMLVLGSFDWTTSDAHLFILGTLNGATAGDLAEINVALGNGGFSGWTAFSDKLICCIPEPGTLTLLVLGVLILLRRTRSQ